MKRMRLGLLFPVFLILTGCFHRYQDPEPTYYGDTEYHCFYYNKNTLQPYEGKDTVKQSAQMQAQMKCQKAGSLTSCVFDQCVAR